MIKFYNNGNSLIKIEETPEYPDKNLMDSGLIGVIINSRNYDLNFGMGEDMTQSDLIEYILKQKITSIKLFDHFPTFSFGDFSTDDGEYEHLQGWKFKSSRKEYDLTEKPFKDKLKWFKIMLRNSDLSDEELYGIVSSLEYEKFFCNCIDMYEHSGISLSMHTKPSMCSSGVVFSTYEKNGNPTREEFESLWDNYKRYVEGYIKEFYVSYFEKGDNGEWSRTDDLCSYGENEEEVLASLGELQNVVDEPDESLYESIRKNLTKEELLRNLCYLP